MGGEAIELQKKLRLQVRDIVERRLLNAPEKLREYLPQILFKPDVDCFLYLTDAYFILALVDMDAKTRFKKLEKKWGEPFPFLIKPKQTPSSMATFIHLEKTQKGLLDHNSVKNAFALSLGKDCTVMLWNHKQSMETRQVILEYVVDLAYIISFGDQINLRNCPTFLEDLIAFSLKQWKSIHDG